MIHHLYNHNFAPWRSRVKRINGALTYSKDICDYYIPILDNTVCCELSDEENKTSIVVSTCAPLGKYIARDVIGTHRKYGVLVQFLHSYPYEGQLMQLQKVWEAYRNFFEEIVFVTAYAEYAREINHYGRNKTLSAQFVPMRIGSVPKVKVNKPKENRAVWFGNIYRDKLNIYEKVVKACSESGVDLITIESGKLNGQEITQQAAWQIMSDAGFVFGVGRCALEAYAMGCYVVIAGAKFGGTVITKEDWKIQESTNFNGRLHTGHQTIEEAIYETQYAMLTVEERPNSGEGRILCESLINDRGGLLW